MPELEIDLKKRKELEERSQQILDIFRSLDVSYSIEERSINYPKSAFFRWRHAFFLILGTLFLLSDADFLKLVGFFMLLLGGYGLFETFRVSRLLAPHLIRLKELEQELTSVREKLFGYWGWFRVNEEKLEQGLLDALEKGRLNFHKDKDGKIYPHFSIVLSPTTYTWLDDYREFGDRYVEPGTAKLEIHGGLGKDGKVVFDERMTGKLSATLSMFNGKSSNDYIVVSYTDSVVRKDYDDPKRMFPKLWPQINMKYHKER